MFNLNKKRGVFSLLLLLLLVLVLLSSASLGLAQTSDNGFTAESVTAVSTFSGTEKDVAAARSSEGLDVSELETVSIIVTFDETLTAQDLAAVSSGELVYEYKNAFRGASLIMSGSQVDDVAELSGVTGVYLDELQQLDTDNSPGYIGAPTLWQQFGGQSNAGEGMVFGIIDSGVWPEHPSFSDPDPLGNPYPTPPVTGLPCEFGNTAWNPNDVPFECNNKLIGAYAFLDTYKQVQPLLPTEFDSARDDNGHGSHTASTAAGNANVAASIVGSDLGLVTGIAPRAHIINYRVCGLVGCYNSDSMAAVDQSIADGADVISFSIGGGSTPYSDIVSLAFLRAYDNGIFVSKSAGNAGPGADTVNGRSPWVTTVGASTHDRSFVGQLTLEADGDTVTLPGVSVTGSHTAEVVLAADSGDELCAAPFAPGTWSNNEIVACARGGGINRVTKGENVFLGGAGGFVLYNVGLNNLVNDVHFLPSVHIQDDAGIVMLDFLAAHAGAPVIGTVEGGIKVASQGDVMAGFSSRGGPGQTLGISKPDITAPGVQILAANTPLPATTAAGAPGTLFQLIQGTSMSTPHIAGTALLLKSLHPDWTPGQIKSAIMTTATVDGLVKEDGVTPVDHFDAGSGRVDLTAVNNPGLTISDSGQSFVDHENDLWNTNYPSLYIPNMPGVVTVQRTLHSELDYDAWWTVYVDSPDDLIVDVPSVVGLRANRDKGLDITLDASTVPVGEVRFATLVLQHGDITARFPITIVREQAAVTLEKTCTPASFASGGTAECTLTLQNNSFDNADVHLQDVLPRRLRLVPGSVAGATQDASRVLSFSGSLYAQTPPDVDVIDGTGTTPAGGYLPLSAFGMTPVSGVGDETITNFPVPPFEYAGQTYTNIGMVSNGYAVVGGGSSSDVDYINQSLPDAAIPNNVLAPFWTDLDASAGGAMYASTLSDGVNTWLVLDWEAVPNFGDGEVNSFQIWIGLNGVEDISFAYGDVSDGDGGFLTVGAENSFGNSGANWYFDGAGTAVANGSEVRVVSIPGEPGETHTVTFSVTGTIPGAWTNCAELTSNLFEGTNAACFSGEITE